MDFKISCKDAETLVKLRNTHYKKHSYFINKSRRTQFLEECGLKSTNENSVYYGDKESYLYIVDKQKWMLAKIKYGI